MVGEQHNLVFECHLGPLQQIHLVVQHGTGDADEAVGVLQAQTVETVAQHLFHFLCEAGIGIGDILFQYVDEA